jgi:hypothetical protein
MNKLINLLILFFGETALEINLENTIFGSQLNQVWEIKFKIR